MLKRGFPFAPGYRLVQFLGRGQFGQVWSASAPGGTLAAVKFIDLSGSEGHKEFAGVKRVKRIRHANLMPITAIWLLDSNWHVIDDVPEDAVATVDLSHAGLGSAEVGTGSLHTQASWLVVAMLLGGKNLQDRLKECQQDGEPGVPPRELLGYLEDAAKGLDFLNSPTHDLGEGPVAIQHCDVKPANLVLLGNSVVICDFGLARILSRNQVTATSTAGTPAYMAPEAIAGRPSRTTDQYSLALTYYHLRTGVLPTSQGSVWEILDAHRRGDLNFSGVPPQEEAVLKRATLLNWEQRFESNAEFIDHLRDALRAEGLARTSSVGWSDSSHASHPTNASQADTVPVDGGHKTPLNFLETTAGVGSSGTVKSAGFLAANKALETEIKPVNPLTVRESKPPLQQPVAAPLVSAPVPASAPTSARPRLNLSIAIAAGSVLALAALTWAIFGRSDNPGETESSLVTGGVVNDPGRKDDGPGSSKKTIASQLEALLKFPPEQFDNSAQEFVKLLEDSPELKEKLSQLHPVNSIGNEGDVRGVTFAGDLLYALSDAKSIQRYDVQQLWHHSSVDLLTTTLSAPLTFERVATHQKFIEAMAIDVHRNRILSVSHDHVARVESHSESKVSAAEFTVDTELLDGAFHPSEAAMVVGGPHKLYVVRLPETELKSDAALKAAAEQDLLEQLRQLAVDPSGRWLLVLDEVGKLSAYDWKTLARSPAQKAEAVVPVLISTVGKPVQRFKTFAGKDGVSQVVLGNELGDVQVVTLSEKPIEAELFSEGSGASVESLAVAASGKAVRYVAGMADGRVVVHAKDAGTLNLKLHNDAVSSVDLSTDGRWLVTASYDGKLYLIDLAGTVPYALQVIEIDAGLAFGLS